MQMSIPKGSQRPCAYGYENTMAVFEGRGPDIPSWWTASECEYLNSETTVVIFYDFYFLLSVGRGL